MQVVGKHQVTVFDSPTNSSIETPEFAILKSGDRYDLRQHRRVETALAEADTPK